MHLRNIQIYNKNKSFVIGTILKLFTANIVDFYEIFKLQKNKIPCLKLVHLTGANAETSDWHKK